MKLKLILSLVILAALATLSAAQTTFLQRFDMSRGSQPYSTTALFLKGGWEVWGFGDTRGDTLDLEVGHPIWNGKHLSLTGYAVLWPDSHKWFALPWVGYSDKFAGGDLTVNLAAYVPLNGGPEIVFSDGTALMWHNHNGGLGVSASFWNQAGVSALRVGPQLEYTQQGTTLRLSFQPIYLVGQGKAVTRVELTTRF